MYLEEIAGSAARAGKQLGPTSYLFHGIFNVVERGAWWWLVYDSVEDFFYAWVSGIMKSEYCTLNAFGSYSGECPFTSDARDDAPNGEDWVITGLQGKCTTFANHANTTKPSTVFATYRIDVRHPGGGEFAFVMTLRAMRDGVILAEKQTTVHETGDDWHTAALELQAAGATTVQFHSDSFAEVEGRDGYAIAVFFQ